MIGWFQAESIQTFEPIIFNNKRVNFVYHHLVHALIYHLLSYPLIPLSIGFKIDLTAIILSLPAVIKVKEKQETNLFKEYSTIDRNKDGKFL